MAQPQKKLYVHQLVEATREVDKVHDILKRQSAKKKKPKSKSKSQLSGAMKELADAKRKAREKLSKYVPIPASDRKVRGKK